MPCPDCGASVAVASDAEHVCNPDRRLDYELFQLREEISELGTEIGDYLASAPGMFEAWQVEQERRRLDPDAPADDQAA